MATWGQTSNTNATNSATFDSVLRMMGGTSPNTDGMVLQSVSLDFSGSGQDIRVAVYQGGTEADPTGATLVEDLGTLDISGARAFYTKNSATNPALTKNVATWIAMKFGASGPTGYWSTSSSDAGDFQTARGRDNITGATGGTDPTVAFPATLDGTDAFASFWYAWYLTYTTGPSITTQPTADTAVVSPSEPAVFTVDCAAATTGMQWQDDGTNISGTDVAVTDTLATGTSVLTLTPTVTTRTGSAITCECTDATGMTESSAATLTVRAGVTEVATTTTTNANGEVTGTLKTDVRAEGSEMLVAFVALKVNGAELSGAGTGAWFAGLAP